MNNQGQARRRRTNRSSRAVTGAVVRSQHNSNLLNKTKPFLVRRNRQLLSLPSHAEGGLALERTFRINNTTIGTGQLNLAQLQAAIEEELNWTRNNANVRVSFTVKAISFYATGPLNVVVHYWTRAAVSGATTGLTIANFSDYTSPGGGLSSIELVYPKDTQPRWDSIEANLNLQNLFSLNKGSDSEFACVDVRVAISTSLPTRTPQLLSPHGFTIASSSHLGDRAGKTPDTSHDQAPITTPHHQLEALNLGSDAADQIDTIESASVPRPKEGFHSPWSEQIE
jgi:hypothetical protein